MGRSVRHLTPRYIANRARQMIYESSHPEAPWLTESAVAILKKKLKPADFGIEWGSGRSTVWFAGRVKRLVSIEHDPSWYAKVKKTLKDKGLENVEYHLYTVKNEYDSSGDHEYVGIAGSIADASADFVLIDGWLRDHCAEAALAKVKRGGMLIIDNANWFLRHKSVSPGSLGEAGIYRSKKWERIDGELRSWQCHWTSNGVNDTAIFIRP